jgi:hypothetical protein
MRKFFSVIQLATLAKRSTGQRFNVEEATGDIAMGNLSISPLSDKN